MVWYENQIRASTGVAAHGGEVPGGLIVLHAMICRGGSRCSAKRFFGRKAPISFFELMSLSVKLLGLSSMFAMPHRFTTRLCGVLSLCCGTAIASAVVVAGPASASLVVAQNVITRGYYETGVERLEQGDVEGAIASLQQALAQYPNYPQARNALGRALQ